MQTFFGIFFDLSDGLVGLSLAATERQPLQGQVNRVKTQTIGAVCNQKAAAKKSLDAGFDHNSNLEARNMRQSRRSQIKSLQMAT